MTVLELGQPTARLLESYGQNAWPFAIAHAILAIFLIYSARKLRLETRGLEDWQPGEPGAGFAAQILASFVTDSGHLGARGFIAPVTDYSDRLDSHLQNLIDEISERTNMFLIVGIAGTLFGVFEFATRTQALRGEDRLALMGAILAESIAKAFPVGFVGLVLMLTFQLTIAPSISSLHEASSGATRRALEHRGTVSHTLADAIADSIERSISRSMKPVSTLGETVSEHLQPVVVALGDRLEQSLALVKSQFGAIDRSTERFTDATAHLQESAAAMTTTSDELRRVLASAPSVLAKTAELQHLQHQALEQVRAAFTRDLQIAHEVTRTLHDVTSSISSLPEQLVQRTTEAIGAAFNTLAVESLASWQNLSESLATEMRLQIASLVIETREEIEKVQRQVTAAADEWKRAATEGELLLGTTLGQGLARFETTTGDVAGKFLAVAESLGTVHSKMLTLPEEVVRQTGSAVGPAFEKIAQISLHTWQELVGKVAISLQDDFTSYTVRTFEEVSRTNQQMHAAGSELQRVAEQTVSFLTEPMKTAIEAARSAASDTLAELNNFVKDAYPGLKKDMDRFATELRGATETLAKTGERLRKVSSDSPVARQDEVVTALHAINDQLKSMRPQPFQWSRLRPSNWFAR